MAFVPVDQSRVLSIDSPEGLQFVIPTKLKVFHLLFLTFWLLGWAFGEVSVVNELLSPNSKHSNDLFIIAWLGAWTVGGGFAILSWAWMLAGRERITLRHDALVHRREVFGFGINREYGLTNIRSLRLTPQAMGAYEMSNGLQFWGLKGGLLAFDYGSRTIRFGVSLEEPEAKMILSALTSRNNTLAGSGSA